MTPLLFIPILLFFHFNQIHSSPPSGDYYGVLRMSSDTYSFYLDCNQDTPRLFILHRKSEQMPLDTIFFANDSLKFRLKEYYSTFAGIYNRNTNTINGQWTNEDFKKYPLKFIPALRDTITGLYPRKTKTFIYNRPLQDKNGIQTCDLSTQHINRESIDSLTHLIMRETFGSIHALLIARNNCLVYEEYFYGFKREHLNGIQSATKSFTSALTGIALMKGEIRDIHEKVCIYLPDYKSLACHSENKSITLHQVLNMSTGLEWTEMQYEYDDERNSLVAAGKEKDPFTFLFSRKRANYSAPFFAYNSVNHLLMNKVLRQATHLTNKKELIQRLLTPLGITSMDLGKPEHGVIGDIWLRPRDMMKFGLLYLNNGNWMDTQVISASWVQESTSAKINLGPGEGYGYFWWTKQFSVKGKTVDTYFAWGYGGQYIFIVPQLELVVVISGSNFIMDERNYAFPMMEDYILPACE